MISVRVSEDRYQINVIFYLIKFYILIYVRIVLEYLLFM